MNVNLLVNHTVFYSFDVDNIIHAILCRIILSVLEGIGRQLCLELAKSSPNVKIIALAKTQANLDSLKAESPGNIETVCVDLCDWDATRKAVKEVLPIHGLVNNAAGAALHPVLEATPESFDWYGKM